VQSPSKRGERGGEREGCTVLEIIRNGRWEVELRVRKEGRLN